MRASKLALGFMALTALAVLLLSCAQTDVVAKFSVSSFQTVTERLTLSQTGSGLAIISPDGERFDFASDFGGEWDAVLSLAAGPFLAAGLDASRLPVTASSEWRIEGDYLVGRFRLADAGSAKTEKSADLLRNLVQAARSRVSYHPQGKHYGIMLDDFAMVEWAASIGDNDKDWVLVLDPSLLAASGARADAVTAWTLARIPVDKPDGSMTEVDKLVKAYNLP